MAERLAQLIRLPTVSAERDATGPAPFDELTDLLARLYPLVHTRLELERHTGYGLLYRWPGRGGADPVVLMAHYDVVPARAEDGWAHPPFAGVVADGVVHGRGALDDKGPLVVLLEAVENLLADGFAPARDVYLALGGDEEVSGDGARTMAAALRDRGIVPWLVLDEGGAVVDAPLPLVTGRSAMVGIAEKGAIAVRLTARGEGGHASAPPASTAIRRLARAVDRIGPSTFPPRMPDAVAAMLERLASSSPRASRAYRLLARSPRLAARVLASMGGEAAALVRTTVAATMVEGGTARNVLPAHASATLDLRLAPGDTIAGTLRRIRSRIRDDGVAVELLSGDEPTPESPADDARFALVADAVAVAYPGVPAVPYLMMQASDARHFHHFAPAVYRFVPLEMSAAQRAGIHGVDEHVAVSSLERGELFHRTLIERLP